MTTQTGLRMLVTEYARRVWNEHDLSAVDDFVPESTLLLDPAGDKYVSRAELKDRIGGVLRVMPDHRLNVGTIVAGDNSVIFQWETSGHWTDGDRGSFPVCFGGMTYWKVVDDRITARDGISDIASFGWQMGVHKRRIRLLMPI